MARRRRRRYSAEFKAEAVAACQQLGVSMASVALTRGLNANLLRRWVVEAEKTGSVAVSSHRAPVESSSGFVPVPLISSPTERAIRIELRSSSGVVIVQWPVSAASECAALLRELTR
jgi:transposase-like protein